MIGFDKLKRLYKGSPLFVQRLYSAIPFSLRAGRVYRETLKQIHLHDAIDEGAIAELQRSALRRLFEHCDRAVPFYRQQFRERGIRVLDEDPFETLRKLPIVSKPTSLRGLVSFRLRDVRRPFTKTIPAAARELLCRSTRTTVCIPLRLPL